MRFIEIICNNYHAIYKPASTRQVVIKHTAEVYDIIRFFCCCSTFYCLGIPRHDDDLCFTADLQFCIG